MLARRVDMAEIVAVPAPSAFSLAAARLGLPPSECLAIEDSPHGVTSAARAGMPVIAVRTPYTADAALQAATRIVNSLEEVDLALPLG